MLKQTAGNATVEAQVQGTPSTKDEVLMMAERNKQCLREMYEAFGRGDVKFIQSKLDDNVMWEYWPDGNTAQKMGFPLFKLRKGPQDVLGFFEELAKHKMNRFDVLCIASANNVVMSHVVCDLTLTNGCRILADEIHYFEFNDAGKVTLYRMHTDTAMHIAALKGEGPKADAVQGEIQKPVAQGTRETENRNIECVRQIYAAFGRHDIKTLLASLDSSVLWQHWPRGFESVEQKMGFPLAKERRGPAEAEGFFTELDKHKIDRFEPLMYTATGNVVMVRCVCDMTLNNGCRTFEDEIHYWEFNEAGKPTLWRYYVDTAQAVAAWKGELPKCK